MFAVMLYACSLAAISVHAQSHHTTTRSTDVLDFILPASDTCSGEDVYIVGVLEGMAQVTTYSNGGINVVTHFTPHVSAIGLTTGLAYAIVGPAQIVENTSSTGSSVFVLVDLIRLISPGSAGNLVITRTVHVTVDANGETVVEFENISAACRG